MIIACCHGHEVDGDIETETSLSECNPHIFSAHVPMAAVTELK